MTTPLRLALIGILALSTALGFGAAGHPWLALIAGILGTGWLTVEAPLKKPTPGTAGKRQPYAGGWAASLGLALFCGLASLGVLFALSSWLALFNVSLALAAWDLARLDRRLQEALDPSALKRIERRHLARLGLALAIGLGLGGLALSVRITLGFVPALALGLLVLVALGLAAREVRRG
jgi:hypothetical protein